MKSFAAQTHYEVLEISVGATGAEVRGAYERLVRLYSEDQVVLYGLVEPERARALRERLKEALEVLGDDERRDAYDRTIGLPPRAGGSAPAEPPPPPAPPRPSGWGAPVAYVVAVSPPQPAPPPTSFFTVNRSGAVRPASEPPPLPSAPPPGRGEGPAPRATPSEARPAASPPAPAPTFDLPRMTAPTPPAQASPPRQAPEVGAPPPAPAVELGAPVAVAPPTPSLAPGDAPALEAAAAEASKEPAPPRPDEVAPAIDSEVGAQPPPRAPEAAPVALEAGSAPVTVAPAPATATAAEALPDEAALAAARLAEFKPEARPKPYEVPEGVEFNGDLLKQVRMARGQSLAQLAERTRISTRHLENVEADRYDQLPATVYLRGILMSVARELGLDGIRVASSYLTFVEAHRSKG